jgi:hypothetical protein
MAEVEHRALAYASGRDPSGLGLELYRLLAIFAGGRGLSERRSDEPLDVFARSIVDFEYLEISRILLTVAIVIRNETDGSDSPTVTQVLPQTVGWLEPDLDGHAGKRHALTFRESLNKIIHAHALNLDRSDPSTMTSGYVNPVVYAYGEKNKSVWKAELEVFAWAQLAYLLA